MCFTRVEVVPAVMQAPMERAAGRRNFERGMGWKSILGTWVLRREVHGARGSVMEALASSFWSEMSAEVLEVSEHFSL